MWWIRPGHKLVSPPARGRGLKPVAVCTRAWNASSTPARDGTLAQHFGFRGPAYQDLELTTEKSPTSTAHGGGEVVEYRDDWRRQFNYLLYGLLDPAETGKSGEATRAAAADEALERYLDCNRRTLTEASLDRLGSFQHAALARFLADRGEPLGAYVRWAERHLSDRPRRHPWQLWLYNVGRLLPAMEDQRQAWRLSLDQCRTAPATIRAMSLLPLAALRALRPAAEADLLRETVELLVWLPRSGLDRAHFAPLTAALSGEAMLEQAPATGAALTPAAADGGGPSWMAAADAALAPGCGGTGPVFPVHLPVTRAAGTAARPRPPWERGHLARFWCNGVAPVAVRAGKGRTSRFLPGAAAGTRGQAPIPFFYPLFLHPWASHRSLTRGSTTSL